MILVPISQVQHPSWGWHHHDAAELAKLTASLHRHGQIQSLLVRCGTNTPPGYSDEPFVYEIVDGRRRLSILQQLGVENVWVHNLGFLSQEQAICHALALELSADIDYAQLAVHVSRLTEGVESLPMTTPFSAERIRYFAELLNFDWAQYSLTNEQVALWETDDEGMPPPKVPVFAAPVVASKPAKPAAARSAAQPPASEANAIALRRAALAGLATAPTAAEAAETLVSVQAAMDHNFVHGATSLAEPVPGILNTQSIVMGEDYSVPQNSDWRPSAPPVLDGINEIELDTETTGLKWWAGDKPIGISIRLPGGLKQYLPWGHKGGNLDENRVKEWAQRELRGKRITNANMRFDNHMLHTWGVDLEEQGCTLEDPQHWSALLDEYRKEVSLNALAEDYLGQRKTGAELDKTRMAEYHAGQVADYACHDVELVHQLKGAMIPLMDAQDLGRVRQLESDVIYPVCEMERNAAHVDRQALNEAVTESGRMLQAMLFDIAHEVGFEMNPDRNADWQRLFEFLKLPEPGRTEPSKSHPNGQPSFADALLEKINNGTVQKARRAGKLASIRQKFLIPYSKVVGADNKLRFFLHQLRGDEYGTIRGRFSTSAGSKGTGTIGGHLQAVMRVNTQRMSFGYAYDDASHDAEIFLVRALFTAETGEYLSADAQSIEYRLAAHFAESTQLIEAYQADRAQLERGDLTSKWVDFHRVVGDVIRPYKDLSRNIIKNANFCLVYGGRETTLASTLGVSRSESDQIYTVWHRMFPELSALPKKAEGIARQRGYVKTILGRRARFTTADALMWAHAAVNYVIQGSAADVMKQKLVELHRARKWTGLVLRQTVHDEADGDATLPETADRVRQILNQQSFNLRVPIVWEVETGKNWAEAH